MNLGRPVSGIAAIAIIATLSGCSTAAMPTVTPEMARDMGTVLVEDDFEVIAAGWAVGGTARILEVAGTPGLFLGVDVTGLTPGDHAWHIHSGGCGNVGGIVVPFTAVGSTMAVGEPLTASAEGTATALVRIPAAQLTRDQILSGDYSVLIHNGRGSPPGRGVACAQI